MTRLLAGLPHDDVPDRRVQGDGILSLFGPFVSTFEIGVCSTARFGLHVQSFREAAYEETAVRAGPRGYRPRVTRVVQAASDRVRVATPRTG